MQSCYNSSSRVVNTADTSLQIKPAVDCSRDISISLSGVDNGYFTVNEEAQVRYLPNLRVSGVVVAR